MVQDTMQSDVVNCSKNMPKSNPINIRLESPVLNEIKNLAKILHLPLSVMLNRLITEALRMFKCPGIIFTNGQTGRRATVAGSGLDVWELINIYKSYGKNQKKILNDYPLTQTQLNVALDYYERYKNEIDEEIKENDEAEEFVRSSKLVTKFNVSL